jgi:hypothetical protein
MDVPSDPEAVLPNGKLTDVPFRRKRGYRTGVGSKGRDSKSHYCGAFHVKGSGVSTPEGDRLFLKWWPLALWRAKRIGVSAGRKRVLQAA